MPTYEYHCEKCGKNFSVTMHMSQHGREGMACPGCKAVTTVQQYKSFYPKTSKKS